MTTILRTAVTVLVSMVLTAPLTRAQDRDTTRMQHNDACLSGEVAMEGLAGKGLTIELRDLTSRSAFPQTALLAANGDFQFNCTVEGDYEVRVLDLTGRVIHHEWISLHSGLNSLRVAPPAERAERPVSGVISVQQLMRKVDPKVLKEMRKAQAAAEKQNFDKARSHLANALRRDPSFAGAYFELGVICAIQNRYDLAADEFKKATRLDPDFASAHSNLAISLVRTEKFGEAEAAARQALKLRHDLRDMEYVLGYSLSAQGRNPEEALEHLQRAAFAYPRARLIAARLLVEGGRRDDAANELKRYLKSSDENDRRNEIEEWLAQLQ